jgi:hypothetical protein
VAELDHGGKEQRDLGEGIVVLFHATRLPEKT